MLHKLIFLWPVIIIMVLSSYLVSRQYLKSKWAQATTILLYCTNPYAMMLISGGQIGVAFAYAFAPLVFTCFLHTLKKINQDLPSIIRFKWYLIAAFSLAVLIGFDARLAVIMVCALGILYGGNWLYSNKQRQLFISYSSFLLLTTLIVSGVHAFWLLPSLAVQSVALPAGNSSEQSVQFFSFARLAHALGWMHPNYPDNLFGVVKEVSGIIFIIPLIAFWSVKTNRKIVLYFSLIALLSAFFIKGANAPFGSIYVWSFNHLPLFSWFRDATKFFLLLSLAYSILIGMTIESWLNSSTSLLKRRVLYLLPMLFIIIWLPTFTKQIKGTLAYRTYPPAFQEIENTLKQDHTFGRVLWIPSREMYGYADLNHPAISLRELRTAPTCHPIFCLPEKNLDPNKKIFTREDLTKEIDEQLAIFNDPYTQELFQELAINYVIVSPDIDHEMYIYDRKYDNSIKEYYSQKIKSVGWLNPIPNKNNLLMQKSIFPGYLFHTGSSTQMKEVKYTFNSPVKYTVKLETPGQPLTVVQSFDDNWVLRQGTKTIYSMPTRLGMIEVPTGDLQKADAVLEFSGERFALIGWTIATVTILIGTSAIIMIQVKGKKSI